MDYRKLGKTDIKVSVICLGTMTWGEQNTEQEAHEQLDYALDHEVNFIDTAEMYAVPPTKETYGKTEEYIGTWIEKRQNRDKYILASKVVGPSDRFPYIRSGVQHLDEKNILEACDNSLRRLKTDYIDLYQLHWPDRNTNFFGKLGYEHDAENDGTPVEVTLRALEKLVQAGKIRYVGLSNETPWGMAEFKRVAREHNLPEVVSIQNPYSLLNRTFEVGLAEMAIREKCGLLAYSPLAFGVLSGKYLGGNMPEKARLTLFPFMERYKSTFSGGKGEASVQAYVDLAKANDLTPVKMALAFINQQNFVTSNIIGATSLEQLKENIDSAQVTLSDEVMNEINAIHHMNPNPCP